MTEIKNLLKKYDIKPNKLMGQNFLIDENVLDKIIEAADLPAGRQGIKKDDTILEVGPGLGILTIELAKRAKRVIAIEKDKKLAGILNDELKIEEIKNVEIVQGDILKVLDSKFLILDSYKLIANIPYYLTSTLIRKFLETAQQPKSMILMVQKEVAQRICARPPKMSILSVAVQFYAKPEIIDIVSKNSFYPIPKVDSAIIKIVPHSNVGRATSYINTKKFFELVKAGFSSKRKMLKNNLPEVDLEKIGLNPMIRAENLSINDWIKIYESFKSFLKQ
jgi:16S rRNA (adenine1518-N6/adenine1519-N6)-dimethyltransferase